VEDIKAVGVEPVVVVLAVVVAGGGLEELEMVGVLMGDTTSDDLSLEALFAALVRLDLAGLASSEVVATSRVDHVDLDSVGDFWGSEEWDSQPVPESNSTQKYCPLAPVGGVVEEEQDPGSKGVKGISHDQQPTRPVALYLDTSSLPVQFPSLPLHFQSLQSPYPSPPSRHSSPSPSPSPSLRPSSSSSPVPHPSQQPHPPP